MMTKPRLMRTLSAVLLSTILLFPITPAATEPRPEHSRALKLDLLVVQDWPGLFPSSYRITMTNVSDHTIVGGNLRLTITIEGDYPYTLYARSSSRAWGEFRLGPKETVVRHLRSEDWIITGPHDGRWDPIAVRRNMKNSKWFVAAIASDETGHDPAEYPTYGVASNKFSFYPMFSRRDPP
jgi:hypothetical protein